MSQKNFWEANVKNIFDASEQITNKLNLGIFWEGFEQMKTFSLPSMYGPALGWCQGDKSGCGFELFIPYQPLGCS